MYLSRATPEDIANAIRLGEITVAVVGIGHIGLDLAVRFADANAKVLGADKNPKAVKRINNAETSSFEAELGELIKRNVEAGRLRATTNTTEASKRADVIVISVPTPLDEKSEPDLSFVENAASMVGKGLTEGSIVIVASTVYIGATRNVVLPILEKESDLKAGVDFWLATVPQRVDPGNPEHRLENTPLIVGGIDEKSADIACAIFGTIVNAEVKKVRNSEVAESAKLVENVCRDINIAFMNELAQLFERIGIDIIEVIDACSTKWNFQPYFPGPGVGGECIPVNPYYLLRGTQPSELRLVRLAREINESMPDHVIGTIVEGLRGIGKPIEKSKIAILGLTYKGDMKDTRQSPAEKIIKKLEEQDAQVAVHDPILPLLSRHFDHVNLPFDEAVTDADCVVFLTDHTAFKNLRLEDLKGLAHNPSLLVDGRHILRPSSVKGSGHHYRGLGRLGVSSLTKDDVLRRQNHS